MAVTILFMWVFNQYLTLALDYKLRLPLELSRVLNVYYYDTQLLVGHGGYLVNMWAIDLTVWADL